VTVLALAITRAPAPSLAAGAVAAGVVALGPGSAATDADAASGAATASSTSVPASARRGALRAATGAVAAVGVGSFLGLRPWADAGPGGTATASDAEGDRPTGDAPVDALLAAAAERTLDVAGLEPLVSENHYQVDINSVDPTVAAADWTLSLTGAVDEEREITFEELTAMPAEHRFVTLRCVGEPLNGEKIDTALWTGVPVTDVLGDVPDDCCVMFRAEDDFYEEFPATALEDALLAYRMNGGPLPKGHGRPVRALVPGHWGEINVKWISEIEILTEPQDGYWEKRGWHGTGPVNTVAKLHAVDTDVGDGRVEVGGHAYAGTRGIDRVEVSTDGGDTWTRAALSDPLPGRVPADGDAAVEGTATDAWRMWRHEYAADGVHEVVVRAVDGTGSLQPSEESDSFPSGASGWVSQTVRP
jgi:DMSO/TMAO reductase YedYZ molybdopterin-dependent catalytic subunit